MRVLTEIGEASAQLGDRIFVFRPSLAHIAEIGTPAEIVEAYALLHSFPPVAPHPSAQPRVNRSHYYAQLGMAVQVLYCCCDDPDVGDLVGSCHPPYKFKAGAMSPDAVIAIARQMMRHGVVGVMPDAQRPKADRDDYTPEFSAIDMATIAQVHLGVSVDEAWSMTMTSLLRAMAMKYPPLGKDGKPVSSGPAMTVEDNDAAVSWLQKVNNLRGAKNV